MKYNEFLEIMERNFGSGIGPDYGVEEISKEMIEFYDPKIMAELRAFIEQNILSGKLWRQSDEIANRANLWFDNERRFRSFFKVFLEALSPSAGDHTSSPSS
ncbi:MAG: hypothetical protein KDA53_15115 [Hyphomonas sp.]|nr:hypothetical protein [Hyphomonas sp.]